MLTREEILKADDRTVEEIEVPERGGTVRVRAMTGAERDQFEASMIMEKNETRADKLGNIRAKLCAMTIVGADGKTPEFTVAEIAALGAKNAKALNRVFEAARELSGFSDKDVKELEKN